MIKAVLFDLDDTLHDKSATLRRMADLQYVRFGLAEAVGDRQDWIESYVALNNIKMPKSRVFEQLRDRYRLPQNTAEELLIEFDRECGRHAQPFPGMKELLSAIKARSLVLGCVTNGRDAFQRSKLSGLGVTTLFDSVVTSEGYGAKKPDESIFLHSLLALGVHSEDAVFVGDSFEADMVPARTLGMHTIWKSSRSAAGITFCSDSLDEIRTHILGCLG